MNMIDDLGKSMDSLINYIKKGSKMVWFYRDKNGIPMYDVYLGDDGKKTNKEGHPIQCFHCDAEQLLSELDGRLDGLMTSNKIVQGKLF